MSQTPTFLVSEPSSLVGSPAKWSFSSLSSFWKCPKRWALAQGSFPCFGGRVPQKPNRNTVEGTLLHELLEAYVRATYNADTVAFRPRRELLRLVGNWREGNAGNPRIDSRALSFQVRIEEILREFAEAISMGSLRSSRAINSGEGNDRVKGPRTNGVEIWMQDPESKLCGRADLIESGAITDFKSGEQKEDHGKQMLFYGGLYLACTESMPKALRLVYARKGDEVFIAVPERGELEEHLNRLRQLCGDADSDIANGVLPAMPSKENCDFCFVRGLCGQYWDFLRSETHLDWNENVLIVDYTPTSEAVIQPAACGLYIRDRLFGMPSSLMLGSDVIGELGDSTREMRLTSMRLKVEGDSVHLSLTQASEIYILEKPGPSSKSR